MKYCGITNFPINQEIYSENLTGINSIYNGEIGISSHPLNNKLNNWIGIIFKNLNISIDIRIENILMVDKDKFLEDKIEKFLVLDNLDENQVLNILENEFDIPIEVLQKHIYNYKKVRLKEKGFSFKGKSEEYFINLKFEELKEIFKNH